MSDQNMPIQPIGELDMPPASGWVVHEAVGKPQSTSNQTIWAWCRVEPDEPGYVEIHFTLPDGSTPADPYPEINGRRNPVRLGPVLFKVFC